MTTVEALTGHDDRLNQAVAMAHDDAEQPHASVLQGVATIDNAQDARRANARSASAVRFRSGPAHG
jgi:hypothetical protein